MPFCTVQHGAVIDFHSGTVEEQQVPYIHPSENGGKADVRWIALRKGQGGAGILLQAERNRPFEVHGHVICNVEPFAVVFCVPRHSLSVIS